MPSRHVAFLDEVPPPLREGLRQLRDALGVPEDFPPEVVEAAEAAVADVRLPEQDLTDVEFITIDPEGSMDLDQALHLSRTDGGYLVRYAIADVAAFVEPGERSMTSATSESRRCTRPTGARPCTLRC